MALQLEKGKPIAFEKGAAIAEVVLTWTTNTDADLGAMCKAVGQDPYVVQALGKTFGSLDEPPFVMLDKDDRHGGQETLRINLAHADKIERVLVYGTIYEGGNWKKVGDARVTVRHPQHLDYAIDLGKSRARSVGLVDFRQVNGLIGMWRLEDFINGTEADIDKFYGFPNLSWTSGQK